jgi:flagellar P-ring protein precursor FlgI
MRKTLLITTIALCCVIASEAQAVKVADVTRVAGQRRNFLTAYGLVVGLKGTGDGDKPATINPTRELLAKLGDPVTAKELGPAENVALVLVQASIPPNGVRQGDELDVHVSSVGGASSLRGGRLFVCPMQGPTPGSPFLALAQGAIEIEDPSTPTTAVVKKGAVMEVDMAYRFIENGRFWLVLDDSAASWTAASNIAKLINDAEGTKGESLATAVDPKNVLVQIPQIEQAHPDSFISRVQSLGPIPLLATEARVQINERTATMIVTGDVEISPVVISHKGLTISTIDPTPKPTPRNPTITTKEMVALDTTRAGGAKLQDLVGALEQLKVPAEDRITIVKELHKTGKLHAKLIVE